jgi:transcriptional regulator with GAF, ATPase, and Fis domain
MPRGYAARPRSESYYFSKLELERRLILHLALARAPGNVTHAARELGLQRTYLLYLLRKRGLSARLYR